MKFFRFNDDKPKPALTHEERVLLAIRRLRAKHNRVMCDEDCDTLVVLEELERVRKR